MYCPKSHQVTDLSIMHKLIADHPLGAWITQGEEASSPTLIANHIPFVLDTTRGEYGVLVCHVARANPVWQSFSQTSDSIVIFQGPQAYISPNWYPSKQDHGKAVPTWNYATVHAHGIPSTFDDPDRLLQHLHELTGQHEVKQAAPWQISDAPADYIANLLNAIVGIEIPIRKIEGKWKTSQNRPEADQRGVVDALMAQGGEQSAAMAGLVRAAAGLGSS